MEINKYISSNILKQLNNKGWDESSVMNKINDFIVERKEMGFEGNALELSIKNRIRGFFAPILRKNTQMLKIIILSLSEPVDENERIKRMSKLKEGTSGYKPDTSYEVQEGFYPWGNQQGKEIPLEPKWEMEGFGGIQYNNKLIYKPIKFSGDWLQDKELNKAKVGDVIQIELDPNKLDNKIIYATNYKWVEELAEEKYLDIINNKLKGYHKTISEIVDKQYNGFVIIKGSVSDIDSNNYGFNFDIIDDADNWDIENSLTGAMKEVPFIDGAENLIFIGNVYKKGKGNPGFGMNIQKVIVPEKFKKKELPKEVITSIENEFNSSIEEEIDDDLL